MEIKIVFENAYYAKIPLCPQKVAQELYDYLSIYNPNAIWSEKFKSGVWDGKKHFFSKVTYRFPQCLLEFVVDFLKNKGYSVNVDQRPLIFPSFNQYLIPKNISLRDYQIECIQKCLSNGFGIIQSPTSSGKTIIIAALIKHYSTKTLILVHRKTLAEQLYSRLNEWGIDCDIIHGESTIEFNDRDVCILLVQSASNIDDFSKFKLVIVDEIHSAVAKSFNDIIKKCTNAYNRFGFSATVQNPKTVEGLSLIADYGMIIYDLKIKDIIDKNVLSDPKIIMIINKKEKAIIKNDEEKIYSNSSWATIENRVYVYNIYRNMLIAYLTKKNKDKKVFLLVKRKDHGEFLSSILKVPYLCGETPILERKRIIEEFENSENGILLGNEQVLGVGLDLRGGVDVMINCSGSKSDIPVIQKVGRALRKNKSNSVIIYDFFDDDKNVINHSKERLNIYKSLFGNDRVSIVDIDANNELYESIKKIV